MATTTTTPGKDAATTGPSVQALELDDMQPTAPSKNARGDSSFGRVLDVSVVLTARIGSVKKTICDVIDLAPGSVIDLGRDSSEPIDLMIGEKLIARGEIVVVDDRYGVRITEIVQDGV